MRPALLLTLLLAALVALAPPPAARALPGDVPAAVSEASVDTDALAVTGFFKIHLEFLPEEDIDRPVTIALELAIGDRTLLAWDHTPTPPTSTWKKGAKAVCDIVAPYPAELIGTDTRELGVYVGFRDPSNGTIYPPHGAWSGKPGKGLVTKMTVPEITPVTEEARVLAILAAADALAKAARKPDAWAALEFGIRAAPADAVKLRFRDAMTKLGDFAPRPLTAVEEQVVQERIDDERERYLRQQSGRLWDQGKLYAALRILETIGGKLQEKADAAVIGALNAAQRTSRDVQDLRDKIVKRMSPEEKKDAETALASLGRTKAALDRAREWTKAGHFGQARWILHELTVEAPDDIRAAAAEEIKSADKACLAAIPADEKAAADAELNHPAFARTTVALSHEFIFIGPKTVVETMPAPSKFQFDLAYVFLTDLFGRRPNPAGDRVTVYFKELWEFGGGVGGGKIIDIGSVKPETVGTRVDTSLLFHELTHCIDDTSPVHSGFHEGLADFGAAFTHEMLGHVTEAQAGFAAAHGAFKHDYLDRDLEYFRIPNYGPSAGFFLSFVDKYAKAPAGAGTAHEWTGYRRFFREYRTAPVKDGREPCVARAIAHYLMRAFGPGAFDDLVQFRFPLAEGDREAVARELALFDDGDGAVEGASDELQKFTNTPLRRDLIERRLIEMAKSDPDGAETRRAAHDELGVIFDWRVIGPFEPQGADPGAEVFVPEHTIDFTKEYPQKMNTCRWVAIDPTKTVRPVQLDPLGWMLIEYPYQDDTASYGLTHVTVNEDTDAVFHVLGADDDVALFVGGERLDGYISRGWNDSSQLWWRGPVEHAPDAIRFAVKLKKGRTPVLIKIRNRGGVAGFVVAVSKRDGRPIAGLKTDNEPLDPSKASAAPKWHEGVKIDFKTKAALQKLDQVVGGLEVQNKLGSGTSTSKGVAWRKYTVRPGFPKDSPSNLVWLKAKETEGLAEVDEKHPDAKSSASAADFRLRIELAPSKDAPKLAITFQGEGANDGLSGWNLLLWNSGGKCGGQLERYEDLWYQWTPAEIPAQETTELIVMLVQRRLTVTMNGATLIDAAPVRLIPGKHRIGISTWGADPKFAAIGLQTGKD